MEPPIFIRLANDFGENGTRAVQFLRTAKTLIESPTSAPKIGESIAYCLREALVTIPRTGRLEPNRWRLVSRDVVDARRRYEQALGFTGMEDQALSALQDLLRSIDDLDTIHHQESIHLDGLRQIIKQRTGVDPLTHDAHVLPQYQKLIDDINGAVHGELRSQNISVEVASQYYERSIDVLSRLFLVDPRIDRLKELASQPNPTSADLETLNRYVITPIDMRFFASLITSPAWLDLMLDHELLALPTNPSEMWPAATMIYRLRDNHGEALASWLEKAWGKWGSTDHGMISLATGAFNAGQNGYSVLLRCIQARSGVSPICKFGCWAVDDMESADRLVLSFADSLLNPAAALDSYEKKRVVDKVVSGINADNWLACVELMVYKVQAHINSEKYFYLPEDNSIGDRSEESRYNFAKALIEALIRALRAAIDLGQTTADLTEATKNLPLAIGDRVSVWLRTNEKSAHCQANIEFIADAIRTRIPTADDVLLVDAIHDQCGLDGAVVLWEEALGEPPEPVTLGSLVGQNTVPDDIRRQWGWSVILPKEATISWLETQFILGAALGRIERSDFLRTRDRTTFLSGPNSPFDASELESKLPEEVADLLAAWRPSAGDSWNMISPRGVGRQLEQIVAKDAACWAVSPVEIVARLRHPTYIAHFFAGLGTDATSLSEFGNQLMQAIGLARTHPWPPITMEGDDFDYDHDWQSADKCGIDLIGSLAQNYVPLDDAATNRAWSMVIDAIRDKSAQSGLLGDDTDFLSSAINRPCTKALETLLKLVEYEHKRNAPVPEEALVVLTEILQLEGKDGAEHRAILAHKIPFLRAVLEEWLQDNLELLLGAKAPQGLAQETINLWLRWGRADRWMLEGFRGQILEAVRLGSERALEGFLLGMYWEIPDYEPTFILRDLVDLGKGHVSDCGDVAARLIAAEDTPSEIIECGIALWEEALQTVSNGEELKGFGWWADVSNIEPERWERLMLETCRLAKGQLSQADRIAERTSKCPESENALRILALLVRSQLEPWETHQVNESAMKSLQDSRAYLYGTEVRDDLRRALLERGNYGAHDID